jgi:DNA segregation ATPase FtsK/SpoIIIE-like protein
MVDLKTLEAKVNELELRLKILEDRSVQNTDQSDREYMAALYQKAKTIVIKHRKASKIFLQKKLLIDFERASKLLDLLQADGVIGPPVDGQPRNVIK